LNICQLTNCTRPKTLPWGCILTYLALVIAISQPSFSIQLPVYDGKPGVETGQECINPKDSAVMVWVPAGSFLMGSKEENASDETPQRSVQISGMWIYKTEVTVAQYKVFCATTKREFPKLPAQSAADNFPIVLITWHDAIAYSKWAGANLPTEAEWEKSARGTDGRTYPWGNVWDATRCNTADAGPRRTVTVGSYPNGSSLYGCLDMIGNVWEWCADWYGEAYYKKPLIENPTGPNEGNRRVIRGASWLSTESWFSRCSLRLGLHPGGRLDIIGFRCVVRPGNI
jgi:formylglycine-generating enzyme required for sulfatase activity